MYDGKQLLTKGTSVLYQNRYCDQEHFDLIIAGELSDNERENVVPNIYNIKYPSFTSVTTLVANSKYTDKVLTSSSSVWITRTLETNINVSGLSPGSFNVWNNVVKFPDLRVD